MKYNLFLSALFLVFLLVCQPVQAQSDDDASDQYNVDTLLPGSGESSDTGDTSLPPPDPGLVYGNDSGSTDTGGSMDAASETSTESKVNTILEDPAGSDKSSVDYKVPDDLNGTLADDDPDSQAFKEKTLFGDEEASDKDAVDGEEGAAEDLPEPDDDTPTHLIKLDFESQVTVTDVKTGLSTLEITYEVKMEQEVRVVEKRFRTTATVDIITDVVGQLAGNDLFTCKLDIQMEDVEADVMTRLHKTEATEELPALTQLALQIKFDKDNIMEDWFSNCLGVDGSMFNTKGDREKYLYTALKAVAPDLNGVLVEEYDRNEDSSVDLTVEPTIIVDDETREEYLIDGNGTIEIEPLP